MATGFFKVIIFDVFNISNKSSRKWGRSKMTSLKFPSFSISNRIANFEQVFVSWCFTISVTVINKLNLQTALSNTQQCFQHCPLQKQTSVHFKPNTLQLHLSLQPFFSIAVLQ